MDRALQSLKALLDKREADHTIRALALKGHLIDFASNDYLGYARNRKLNDWVNQEVANHLDLPEGATGSRLISGNHTLYEALEREIAAFHDAPAGLIFNSGYDANIGLFSSVPQKDDLILFDELVHASIRDGIKLSRASSLSFRHHDLGDLYAKLQGNYRHIFIATESIFSMDGDLAPLQEMVAICKKTGAHLVVDEAHATGVFGANGEGLVQQLGLQEYCFARVHTFGKALGAHGAIVLGNELLKQFLINYARSFIYTTALPLHSLLRIKGAYAQLGNRMEEVDQLRNNCKLFKDLIGVVPSNNLIANEGPIFSLLIPGNQQAKNISAQLESAGIYCKAILYPTVARGQERIRVCMHSFNTKSEIELLASTINQFLS
ncbi:MAG: pyridoxal phosphate-dependent aminotransferase family protein [Chitinophagales bacterium]|nr:pyridoxal phosphate-dependent aminotransferase family protein [Chitinophagales bacterium]